MENHKLNARKFLISQQVNYGLLAKPHLITYGIY